MLYLKIIFSTQRKICHPSFEVELSNKRNVKVVKGQSIIYLCHVVHTPHTHTCSSMMADLKNLQHLSYDTQISRYW